MRSLLLICLILTTLGHAKTPAPEGFSWLRIDDLKASFLLPDGWYYTLHQGKLRGSLVIAKEPPGIGQHGPRLTVALVNDLGKSNGRLLSEKIPDFVASLKAQSSYAVLSVKNTRRGLLQGVLIHYHDTSITPPVSVQRLYLAHDGSDTLAIITYQNRADDQNAWRIGDILLNHFQLEP